MTAPTRWRRWLAGGLWLVLALPPIRHVLEATMTLQMLVQIPLLAFAGWQFAAWPPWRVGDALAAWNRSGIAGLVLASLTTMVWMLPRALDAALESHWVEIAKFLSVPLLIGAPVAISWPRAGFVVRGVLLVEVVATMYRLGWLYMASPVRLCSNYLLGDQQLLGKSMLAIGVAISLLLAWKLVWGRIDTGGATGG